MTTLTVTAAQGGTTGNGLALRVKVLTSAQTASFGATGSQSVASGASASAASVTTTVTGSQVYFALTRGASAATYTAAAGSTLFDNITDGVNTECYGTGRTTAATGTPGAVTVGSSAPTASTSHGAAALEVLAAGTITEDASAPAVASTTAATTVTTASFTPPPGSLLVAMVGSDGGAGVTTMTVSGGGLTWTERVKGNASGGDYAGVWTAVVPAAAAGAALQRPQQPRRRTPARARAGRLGLCAAGILGLVNGAPAVTPAPPAVRPPVIRHVVPHRAVTRGNAGLVNPPAGPPQPSIPGTVSPGRTPQRASWRGIAGGAPAAAGARVPAPPLRPAPPRSRTPQRATWRRSAGPAPAAAPLRVPAPGLRPALPRKAPARAHAGPSGAAAAGVSGLGNATQQALGAPPPAATYVTGPFITRRAVWRGVRGPANATTAVVATIVRRPPPPRRSIPARARVGPGGQAAGGVASQVSTPLGEPPPLVPLVIGPHRTTRATWRRSVPATASTAPSAPSPVAPAPPRQPRRPAPGRGIWRRSAGRANAVPGITPAPKLPPVHRPPPPRRATWRGNAGPGNAAPPPPPVYGTARHAVMAVPAAQAGDASTTEARAVAGAMTIPRAEGAQFP